MKFKKNFTIAETFVGAGGNHIGWSRQGFKTIYINDFDENMINTIIHNNKNLKKTFIDKNNILDINPYNILKKINLKFGELDVLFGGIVCKGFSLAGERNPLDKRNYFYQKQIKLVKAWSPKISIIENVGGILSAQILSNNTPQKIKNEIMIILKKINKNKFERSKSNKKITKIRKIELEKEFKNLKIKKQTILKHIKKNDFFVSVMDNIKKMYKKLNYKVYFKILKSSEYGVATTRKRVFIIATRNDMKGDYKFPKPTTKDGFLTIKKVLEKFEINSADPDSIPMKHTKKVVERFSYIPEGKNIAEIMEIIPNRLKINNFFSRGANMRLSWNLPAPTLVPGHSAFPLHPSENRSITVREAALITGFPKKYKFFGNHSKRCEQVGNAIPPKLAEAVAKSVRLFLEKQ